MREGRPGFRTFRIGRPWLTAAVLVLLVVLAGHTWSKVREHGMPELDAGRIRTGVMLAAVFVGAGIAIRVGRKRIRESQARTP